MVKELLMTTFMVMVIMRLMIQIMAMTMVMMIMTLARLLLIMILIASLMMEVTMTMKTRRKTMKMGCGGDVPSMTFDLSYAHTPCGPTSGCHILHGSHCCGFRSHTCVCPQGVG